MAQPRLLDVERTYVLRSRCKELVPFPVDECLSCGGPTREAIVGEMALFIHGGYGADRVTVFRLCENYECRAVRVARITEANPRRRAPSSFPSHPLPESNK